jgi:hypothetical protein
VAVVDTPSAAVFTSFPVKTTPSFPVILIFLKIASAMAILARLLFLCVIVSYSTVRGFEYWKNIPRFPCHHPQLKWKEGHKQESVQGVLEVPLTSTALALRVRGGGAAGIIVTLVKVVIRNPVLILRKFFVCASLED